jgi:hypothetical protein
VVLHFLLVLPELYMLQIEAEQAAMEALVEIQVI